MGKGDLTANEKFTEWSDLQRNSVEELKEHVRLSIKR